jgi:hypothetical protein
MILFGQPPTISGVPDGTCFVSKPNYNAYRHYKNHSTIFQYGDENANLPKYAAGMVMVCLSLILSKKRCRRGINHAGIIAKP